MASPISPPSALRALRSTTHTSLTRSNTPQIRHATLLRRPKRPYTFTQLVTLSDGSTFLHRTTSPIPVYKSTKDIMNTATWNPSSQSLLNAEDDEAGKLAAFRAKFGRGWDVEGGSGGGAEGVDAVKTKEEAPVENLMDLISGYGKVPEKKEKVSKEKAPAKKSK